MPRAEAARERATRGFRLSTKEKIDALLEAVRESCSSQTWSRGVALARSGVPTVRRLSSDEVEVRFSMKGGATAPTATLYLADGEWTCQCSSIEDACPHVAAAVIAWSQAEARGESLGGDDAASPGHVGYRLERRHGKLVVRRVIVKGSDELPVPGSLARAAVGAGRPSVDATAQDLLFESRLGLVDGAELTRALAAICLELLADAHDVTLDGQRVTIGAPTAGLHVRVTATQGGHLVKLETDDDIDEVLPGGVLRKSSVLMAAADPGLDPREAEQLTRGRFFPARDLGTLAGEVLPRLERLLPVVSDGAVLPGATRLRPRIEVSCEREGDVLQILPLIVYGDPPRARVDGEHLVALDDGPVPVRNPKLERQLAARVRDALGMEPGVRRKLLPDDAARFLADLERRADADVSLARTGGALVVANPLQPRLQLEADGRYRLWFEAPSAEDGTNQTGSRPADAAAVLRAFAQGQELAPLLDGGFGRLPTEWLRQHGQVVADLLSARESAVDDKPASLIETRDLVALCRALDQPLPPRLDALREMVEHFDAIPAAALPDDLHATLRDYQRRGVDWLAFLRQVELGALLADDMGLGKTLQTLAAIRGRTLVVAPTSVLHNWAAEIARFRPGLRVNLYHGAGRTLSGDAEVTLTTYALLRLDVEALASHSWDTIVLDEAQAIKNPDSQAARAAYRLQGKFRVALTGTPVENRLQDLWSQMHFLNPGLLGGLKDFDERWARPVAEGQTNTAARLRERIRPFVLRRLKRDVAQELPPRTDVVLRCELDDGERQVYDAVRAATREEVVARLQTGGSVMAVLEALLRLRQAACHPALIPGQPQRAAETSAKVALLLETLDEVLGEGHKALVFSQWTSLLDLIEPQLRAANIRFGRLDGSTTNRAEVVAEFQDEAGPPVLLVSLRAGGVGLNLTAADHVFIMDPWWNPAVEDQAADRAHRIGQERPVLVQRLVARDTVEERILELQQRKRAIAEAAIGEAGQAYSITKDDLLALLDS